MTEEEWLSGVSANQLALWMVGPFPHGRRKPRLFASRRKLRLFTCAAYRHIRQQPDTEAVFTEAERKFLEFAEHFVEGEASDRDREVLWRHSMKGYSAGEDEPHGKYLLHKDAAEPIVWVTSGYLLREVHSGYKEELVRKIEGEQADLLRDIFGNPFRPVAFAPEWRTSTAVAIAQGMYESRDFGAMPILADALQDAGCDSEDVLNHCRDESQVHVRGCWVVDLVLGKH